MATTTIAYLRARWPDSFGDAGRVTDFSIGEAISAAQGRVNVSAMGSSADEAVALLAAHFAELGKGSRAAGAISASAGGVSASFPGGPDGMGGVTGFLIAYRALCRSKVVSAIVAT